MAGITGITAISGEAVIGPDTAVATGIVTVEAVTGAAVTDAEAVISAGAISEMATETPSADRA